MWQVYIILCSDNSFYTGITTDLERRIDEHNSGKAASYTRGRRPVKLVYQESCQSQSQALKREFQIKSLSRKEKLKLIHLSRCSAFQRKVLRAVSTIPSGEVRTYQSIAKQIGSPRAARAVGAALAANPFPLVIPCHRVICSDGSLGGYSGGVKIKQRLLRREGRL